MREGRFARHLARMRALYRDRQEALLEAARRRLAGLLTVEPTATGMHLVAWLPPGVDDRAAAKAASDAGIEVAPLSSFCLETDLPPGLVLGFASSPDAEINAAMDKLASVLETVSRRARCSPPRGV